jgi:hypothetical protein
MNFVNNKIIISISVIITIVIVGFSLTQLEVTETQTSPTMEGSNPTMEGSNPTMEGSNPIQGMLNQIEQDKTDNKNSENPYIPKEREWIESGPFQIDRSEYALGEKIFVNMNFFEETKGELIFAKILNSTHVIDYFDMPFDSSEDQMNVYLGIYPSKRVNLCTADELVGNWVLIFEGTNYEALEFKITNKIIPGQESKFEPVC